MKVKERNRLHSRVLSDVALSPSATAFNESIKSCWRKRARWQWTLRGFARMITCHAVTKSFSDQQIHLICHLGWSWLLSARLAPDWVSTPLELIRPFVPRPHRGLAEGFAGQLCVCQLSTDRCYYGDQVEDKDLEKFLHIAEIVMHNAEELSATSKQRVVRSRKIYFLVIPIPGNS